VLHETDKVGRGIQLSVHTLLLIAPFSNTEMEGAVRKIKQSLKKIFEMLKCVWKHYGIGQYLKQGVAYWSQT
jgi:hypothetical protein